MKKTIMIRCGTQGVCVLAVLLLSMGSVAAAAVLDGQPSRIFQPGERWTYRATWGVIDAGELVMEVLPMENLDGIEAYHFVMTTKTKGMVDWVYKVRERQESFVDTAMTHSLLYKKRSEGKHPRDVELRFDWATRQAVRSDFGKKMQPVLLEPGTFDSLSLFYIIRCQDLRRKGTLRIPVTDGHQLTIVQAAVGKKETLRIGGKTYDTIEVVPDMRRLEEQAVVKKGQVPDLTIWFTDDDRKIPVRIQSKVAVGYFVFELVSVSN